MTTDQFWKIIDKAHAGADEDMDMKCELLHRELHKLPKDEVQSFADQFDAAMDKAFTWPLWAAAYIIRGGCKIDEFSDFRATLISLGRVTYEKVVANPETLADMDITEDGIFYDGYQYVVGDVFKEMTGALPKRAKKAPKDPSGTPWDEDHVADLFPDLAEKHGFEI
jgi:hypothetical protein